MGRGQNTLLSTGATGVPPRPVAETGAPADLSACLAAMASTYREDPVKAVRSSGFIKQLHAYLGREIDARLTPWARKQGYAVKYEAGILGSYKTKAVDVTLIAPDNGPLMCIGVRSQMSGISKNALNYHEGIVGECMALQSRFPLAVHSYVYLMPVQIIKKKRAEAIDHARYAKLFAAVTGRGGVGWEQIRGKFDEFAYMVVDFESDPPALRDDLVRAGVTDVDLSITTFVDRIIETFAQRMFFLPRPIFDVAATANISR